MQAKSKFYNYTYLPFAILSSSPEEKKTKAK